MCYYYYTFLNYEYDENIQWPQGEFKVIYKKIKHNFSKTVKWPYGETAHGEMATAKRPPLIVLVLF